MDQSSSEAVVLVRFPSRLLLAGAVLGAFVTSGSAALGLPFPLPSPARDSAPAPRTTGDVRQLGAPTVPPADPTPVPAAAGPPVTGPQIAALAVRPAQERVAALLAERARAEAEAAARAEAERAAAPPAPRADGLDDLRQRLRAACESGVIRGALCGDG